MHQMDVKVKVGDFLILKEMVGDHADRESRYGGVIATIGDTVKVLRIEDIGDKDNGLVYHVTRCGDVRRREFVIRDGYFHHPETGEPNE